MPIDVTAEDALTITELARIAKKSKATVRRWMDDGLEFEWLGNERITNRDAVNKYCRQLKQRRIND